MPSPYYEPVRRALGNKIRQLVSGGVEQHAQSLQRDLQAVSSKLEQLDRTPPTFSRGSEYAERWRAPTLDPGVPSPNLEASAEPNPLWEYFSTHSEGPGIWKWEHYFEIYHRHLRRFVGTPASLLEIGIYSGGSLDMWAAYLGERAHIYGVDIEPACKAYERDNVSVFIGDQEDRSFWAQFNDLVDDVDILIDDGGHTVEQQIVTLEEMLPQLRPGGVYLCEDIEGVDNGFAQFAAGLASQLNASHHLSSDTLSAAPTAFQQSVYSVHFYPLVVVIEKHRIAPSIFAAPKHGTEWQPFL